MNRLKPLRVILLLLACGLSWLATPYSFAQTEPSADQVNEIAKHLFCPTCQNVPLDQCGTNVCEQWRATIADLLQQGYTSAQIEQYFAERYGNQVLAAPPSSGWGGVLWALPALVLLAALLGYIRYFTQRRFTSNAQTSSPSDPALSPFIAQLEAELRQSTEQPKS
jgi:cytochrome c-type biogenesis protein CcmH